MKIETLDSDVLVIGGGGAGCRAAVEAVLQNCQVLLISKELFGKAHTGMAEGGYNAALGNVDSSDSWQWHFFDTVEGGAYLNNQALAEILAREAAERVLDLEEYGAIFDRTAEGRIGQRPFGKQTYVRTCYAGDRTGHEMMVTLVEECRKLGIQVMDEIFAYRLLTYDGSVSGVVAFDIKSGDIKVFKSRTIVLATGGAGRIFQITTNAQCDTGDGFAMGYHSGAELIDMEMVQFHPTGMVSPESCRGVLVTEAVRGEGGFLYNAMGERFMRRYNPRMLELAGRDEVARSIATEILEGRGTPSGGVYLSVTHLPKHIVEQRLPSMLEQFEKVGVDIREEPMQVAPTAHHFMGGLKIDQNGSTSIKGLFAAGEVAGGVHGGNRLGGNALADTQVFGARAGKSAAELAKSRNHLEVDRRQLETHVQRIGALGERKEGQNPIALRNKLRRLMWDKVGIFRNSGDLAEAVETLAVWRHEAEKGLMIVNKSSRFNRELVDAMEIENMLLTSEMVARCALMREESRGAHFRRDFPKADDTNWFANLMLKKGERMVIWKAPVNLTRMPRIGMKFNEVNWA
mgnify:CR=1 FL=1